MKDIVIFALIMIALLIVAMGVVGAIFDHDYWRAVASLVSLVLLALAFYPHLMRLTDKRLK